MRIKLCVKEEEIYVRIIVALLTRHDHLGVIAMGVKGLGLLSILLKARDFERGKRKKFSNFASQRSNISHMPGLECSN